MDETSLYILSLAATLHRDGRFAAADSYRTVARAMAEFQKQSPAGFAELTPIYIKSFERFLYARGCCRNTASLYLRLFRSICRQAAGDGLMVFTDELFSLVFMGYDPCDKRAVSADVISLLSELDLSGKRGVAFARDLFLLSFYLRGIPFIDLAHLRKSDIRNGVLYYCRSKTRQPLAVKLEEWALEIIRRYERVVPGSPYLLPVIKRPEEADEHKQYDNALRLYNKRLHQLSRMLNLEKNLTSYVARHTWATLAYHEGIPVSEISAGLSHTSEQVTYAYLDSFSADTLACVNLQVVALVNSLAKKRWESVKYDRKRGRGKPFRFFKGTRTISMQRNS